MSGTRGGQGDRAGTDGHWGTVVTLEDTAGRLWRVCGVTAPP